MSKKTALLALALLCAGCGDGTGTNPVTSPPPPEEPEPEPTPEVDQPLEITEPEDLEEGNGFATGITYDPTTDTFFVDGLAFDGNNIYARDTGFAAGSDVGTLNGFDVFTGPTTATDAVTGAVIGQLQHRALYVRSATGNTELGIVRTGNYVDYGFGGWVIKRNNSVTLPTTGQALYQGNYAGLRDFIGKGGLEFVEGDMAVAIDFEDFNEGDAVAGTITNRVVRDVTGADITGSIITAINNSSADINISQLPTVVFDIGPGVLNTANGSIEGQLTSNIQKIDGTLQQFETGNYYGVLSGANAEELVGVVVISGDDFRDSTTARETGGFLLLRQP